MPTELLSFPPSYSVVGLYRLLTDPTIREPVYAKVKHASVRGAIVSAAYATLGWGIMDWVVKKFVLRGKTGSVKLGHGSLSINVDLLLYTHLLILLPQLGSIMRFFIIKNLRIARSRAFNLTVQSRGKPVEFWNQGYVEEWQQPPTPTTAERKFFGRLRGPTHNQEKWVKWLLWWPSKIVIKNFILLPLSPTLPLLAPIFFSVLRSLQTAEVLHQPYFRTKKMSNQETWTWIEERKWGYRAFGFVAAWLEGLPIIGLLFSVSNRIGAAMWAHDLEKRQHLFSHHVLQPLPPNRTGMFGSGTALDITPEVVRQEKEIHAKWSHRPAYAPVTVDAEQPDEQPPSYEKSEIDSKRVSEVVPESTTGVAASLNAGLTQASQRIPPALPPRKGHAESHMPGGL